jgi:hypothetical protein
VQGGWVNEPVYAKVLGDLLNTSMTGERSISPIEVLLPLAEIAGRPAMIESMNGRPGHVASSNKAVMTRIEDASSEMLI